MLMIGKPLSAEQRLTKAVVDLMSHKKYTALAGVLMVGTREICDKTPTAMTNGRDEKYGRKFVEELSDTNLRFVILHENYHKLYKHLITWRWMYKENPRLANMACDYVINLKIVDDNRDGFAQMPMKNGKPVGLIDERFRDMDAAQVYKLLKQDGDENDSGNEGEDGEDGEEGDGAGGSGSGTGFDDHDWEGAQDMPETERKALERALDEAVRQGALMAGKVGSGGNRDIDALLQPKIDWREALRDFVTAQCAGSDYSTWRRPNRRYIGMNVYLPSTISESVGEVVIAIDTSGSIGREELSPFLGEVKAICETVRPETVHLLYWDTKVCRAERYRTDELDNLVASTKPAGGGGTEVSCVPEYMSKHGISPKAAIILTDGYLGGSWGQWSVPVLWCIVGGNDVIDPVGKTLHVKD